MEDYIYKASHFKILRKYGLMKLLFLLLGCLVLLFQSMSWLIVWYRDMSSSLSDKIFVAITLGATFTFMVSQMYFYTRTNKIMRAIREEGSYTLKRFKLKFSKKTSFAGALAVLCRIITVVFIVLLGIMVVNFIKDYVNWGKVILKMPFMFYCAISMLSVSSEFRYQALLDKNKVS